MFILTVLGEEAEGAYSVLDPEGNRILYLFEAEDDAERYAMMLEEDDTYPDMHVIEVDAESMLNACEVSNTLYTIITKHDIVVPPSKL